MPTQPGDQDGQHPVGRSPSPTRACSGLSVTSAESPSPGRTAVVRGGRPWAASASRWGVGDGQHRAVGAAERWEPAHGRRGEPVGAGRELQPGQGEPGVAVGREAVHPGRDGRGGEGTRQQLDLDEIVRTGIAVADADGLAAVSARAIAARLGRSAMALYRRDRRLPALAGALRTR
ncbi:hypothetical protein GCM10020358_30920 [Amorphoplanes nipponensis]|uniref:TetR family transcriptional regulator n=1 Tax=Actinoplanes nipponensis TaxID=135950 RepID=A0A919MN96_9ACTN|nr:hypothetical protein [Actinoplanes nipponensis]GIE50752.1 hypothetical protein Ani05nite_42860 [Actinoplanes nipponensis]